MTKETVLIREDLQIIQLSGHAVQTGATHIRLRLVYEPQHKDIVCGKRIPCGYRLKAEAVRLEGGLITKVYGLRHPVMVDEKMEVLPFRRSADRDNRARESYSEYKNGILLDFLLAGYKTKEKVTL